MDEPLSNLDAKLRNAVRKDIKKLQRDLGITVVYVTHDQTEAMSMADTVVLDERRAYPTGWLARGLVQQAQQHLCRRVCRRAADGIARVVRFGRVWRRTRQSGSGPRTSRLSPKGEGRMRCTVNESEFLGAETLIGLDHAGAAGLCVLKPGLSMMPKAMRSTSIFTTKICTSLTLRANGWRGKASGRHDNEPKPRERDMKLFSTTGLGAGHCDGSWSCRTGKC